MSIQRLCKCGCGEVIIPKYKHYIPVYIGGHNGRGKKRPDVSKRQYERLKGKYPHQLIKKGEHNGMWKGDDIGYKGLHLWVRSNLPITALCQTIGCLEQPYDLSNVTGVYNRDFENWQYYCRSHHMIFDFRTGVRKK